MISGPEGVFYFTIRAVFEVGTMSISDSSKMVRGPKRQCVSEPRPPTEPAVLAKLTAVETEDLIAMQPDGIAARLVRLPPGGQVKGFDPASGGGQFFVVLGGELLYEGRALQQWESIFVSSDEAAIWLTAELLAWKFCACKWRQKMLSMLLPSRPAWLRRRYRFFRILLCSGTPWFSGKYLCAILIHCRR